MKLLITGGSGFIGTNLISFLRDDFQILNIDINPPVDTTQKEFWKLCDILDKNKLQNEIISFAPSFLLHLAARADVEGKTLDDYKANTEGTKNVLDAVKNTPSVERVVITSTQFVNQYQGIPKHDEDFAPHTVYGESKVITEQLTRRSNIGCCWTIIRPTNIWGPWHGRYPFEFWKVVAQGRYLHPRNQKIIRSYGYVGNVCWQIKRILEIENKYIDHQVFYVGDYPIDILDWVNEFSEQQIGKSVSQVDKKILKLIAFIGDLSKAINIKLPLTSSRLKSMTNSNEAPMEKAYKILGPPPYSLSDGVNETINWLKKNHPHLVKIDN